MAGKLQNECPAWPGPGQNIKGGAGFLRADLTAGKRLVDERASMRFGNFLSAENREKSQFWPGLKGIGGFRMTFFEWNAA
jgi:hypothetical protein